MYKSEQLFKGVNNYISLLLTIVEKNIGVYNSQEKNDVNKLSESFFAG